MSWLYAALRRLLVGVVLAAVFVISVLAGAVVHLDLPAVRRIVENRVNGALSALPIDHAKIAGIRRLTIWGVRIDTVDVDVDGVGRGRVDNLRVEADLLRNLWGTLRHPGAVNLRVRSALASQVTFEVRAGERRTSRAPGEGIGGSEIHLDVGRIEVSHGYVHGQLEKGPYLEVDCDRASGNFSLDPGRVSAALVASINARGLLDVPLSIDLDGSLSMPLGETKAPEPISGSARVDLVARAGEARMEAAATLEGDRVEAEVSLPKTSPEAARAIDRRWPLTAPLSLHARAGGALAEPTFLVDALVGSGQVAVTGRANLRGTPRAHMSVAARRIDPSDFLAALPSLRIGLDSDLDIDPDEIRATATMREHGAFFRADATLTHGVLQAHASLDAEHATFDEVHIDEGHAEAEIGGPLESLRGRLSARLQGLSRGPIGLTDLFVMAEGDADTLDVELAGAGRSLDVLALQARIVPKAPLRIFDLSARFERAQQSIVLQVPEILVSGSAIDVGHLRIQGLGKPIVGEVHFAPGRLQASLAGPEVDLAPLSGFITSSSGRMGGTGSIEVALDTSPRHPRATARARLAHARYAALPEVDASLDLEVDGSHLAGRLELVNEYLATATLESEIDAGRPITGLDSMKDARGSVIVTTEHFSVDRLCAAFLCSPLMARSIASLAGTLGARLEVTRGGADDKKKIEDTQVTLEVEVEDKAGRLAFANVRSEVNLARTLALGHLPLDAPLEARFGLEARTFDELPPIFQPVPLTGRLAIHGYAEGTVSQPFFVVDVRGSALRMRGAPQDTTPFEVGWVTTYDLEDAASDIDLRIGDAHVARGSLQVNASLQQLLGAPGDKPWSGGLYAEIDRFPIALLPQLAERDASGELSGKLSVSGIHQNPAVAGHLSIDNLRFGSELIGPVSLSIEASEQSCVASLDAGAANQAERAMLRARAGCRWKNATIPSLASDVPAEVALDATQFPIVAVQPLLAELFGRLRGNLDAHLRASGRPDQGVSHWAVRGEAHLRDTTLLPLVLGREINRLDVQATADGTGVVRIPQFSGELGAGAFTGQGTLVLRDNSIDKVHAELHVARRKAIPVTMEGVSYGTVWGDVIGDARVVDGQLLANLRAPTLRMELPPQRTGNLERLDHNPAVVVLQPLSATPPATAVGGGPGPTRPRAARVVASVQLGDNVGVSRDDLKIDLTTPPTPQNPKISLDDEVTIDGSIRILGGRVPVAGRVFRVERGVVQFGGSDPGDPALDVDAVYEGPDTSITIKVHVGGTAKDAKITLQSTPAKSQSEILAILTFGEAAPATTGPGGIAGPQQGSTTVAGAAGSAAAGVGSAIVTTGLNQILSQSVIPIRTSISAGTTSTASASASVDFSERIRIEYIRSFGTPSQVGQQIDDNQFAFDWRFRSRWMLRTIVGTRGTAALDLLWQRWY